MKCENCDKNMELTTKNRAETIILTCPKCQKQIIITETTITKKEGKNDN